MFVLTVSNICREKRRCKTTDGRARDKNGTDKMRKLQIYTVKYNLSFAPARKPVNSIYLIINHIFNCILGSKAHSRKSQLYHIGLAVTQLARLRLGVDQDQTKFYR